MKAENIDGTGGERATMGIRIFQVDSFTATPFRGNPAAVCLLEAPAEERWMKDVAREMNLSETAFLLKREDGYDLRWFTPAVEVELCGHATLASAHILWETGELGRRDRARFHTLSGELWAKLKDGWIEMDFPTEPEERAAPPEALLEALPEPPVYVGRNRFDYLVELSSEEAVRGLKPDLALIKKLPARGVIVTAGARAGEDPAFDFVSRFFAPASGIDEDPVTGSAHCCLGPYWGGKLGKKTLVAYQASERGGVVRVGLKDGRVLLAGQAVTVLSGELA